MAEWTSRGGRFPRGLALATVLVTALVAGGPARALDEPDELGPWKVGHRSYFIIAPPPSHLTPGTPQFYDVWYPVDNGDWVGAFTDYTVFTIPPSTAFTITSASAKDDVDVSSTGDRALIVFSHGSGGVAYQSIKMTEALASHGFIVVAPTHDSNNFFDNDGTFADIARQRPKDVSAAIDHMLGRDADAGDDFFGAIDDSLIGVTGHSFGGFIALTMASGYDDGVESIAADARVKAIYPVSPAHLLLDDAELRSIAVPVCYMDGSLEPFSTSAERLFEETGSFLHINCWSKVLGATHTHFANICDIGQALKDGNLCPTGSAPCGPDPTDPDDYDNWNILAPGNSLSGPYVDTCVPPALDLDDVIRLQNLYTVAFFRRHLLGEKAYGPFLTYDYADTEPLIEFFLTAFSAPSLSGGGVLVLGVLVAGAGLWRLRRR